MLTRKELRLAAHLLDMASDVFGNLGCNDFDFPEEWTVEEKRAMHKAFHEYNGDPEEFDPDWLFMGDDTAMAYMAYKLREAAK